MQPEQPNQVPDQPYQADYSVDYLNQIAGGPQQTTAGPSKLVMIIAAVVGLLAVVLFAAMILTAGPSGADRASEVYLRLETLQEISGSQQEELRDNELRAINSGLRLQLTNTLSAATTPLAAVGVDPEEIDERAIAKEEAYKQELVEQFEDAALNVQLDATYSREMAFQLETLRALLDSAYRQSNNERVREFLDQTAKDLWPFNEKFSNFQAV